MSGATIVKIEGRQFGIAAPAASGRVRFFSSSRLADHLDGRTFGSLTAALRAVRRLAPAAAANPDGERSPS